MCLPKKREENIFETLMIAIKFCIYNLLYNTMGDGKNESITCQKSSTQKIVQ